MDHSAIEILSKKWGHVSLIRVISRKDIGPLLLLCSGEANSNLYPSRHISFYSLKENTFLKDETIILDDDISDIQVNSKYIAVGLKNKHHIQLYDIETFKLVHVIEHCWKSQKKFDSKPVFSLGESWIAFQTRHIIMQHKSISMKKDKKNNLDNDDLNDHSYPNKNFTNFTKEDFVKVANTTMKQMIYSGSKLYKSFLENEGYSFSHLPNDSNGEIPPGFIEIMDLNTKKPISIFQADSKRIARIDFDPSGLLLLTTPDGGQELKIWFSYHIDPIQKPMYILQRGSTLSSILDVRFNDLGNLVSFTSSKGTTHIFPILPQGGEADASSHLEKKDYFKFSKQIQTYKPHKLETIHTISDVISKSFAGLSYIYSYPLKRNSSNEKREKHINDYSCLIFHPNGFLIRYDLHLTRNPQKLTLLYSNTIPKYQWDLCRSRESKDIDYKQKDIKMYDKKQMDPLSQIETNTFKADENIQYLWKKKIFDMNPKLNHQEI